MSKLRILEMPQYVGSLWITDSYSIAMLNKPSRWHLFWMKTLLGWRWEDSK